ncbi:DNA ligase (ATP) [Orobanche gracilis]
MLSRTSLWFWFLWKNYVIHQTLKERHEILHKVVRQLKGRLEILIPNDGLNSHRSAG